MGRAFGQKIRFTPRRAASGPRRRPAGRPGRPRAVVGISVPSDGWHAPNEKVELDLLMKGVETAAHPLGRPRRGPGRALAAAPAPDAPRPSPQGVSWKQP
ncbi:hypothetical protein [Streptomyces thioluteus]|uniref:hypothetical protein n=1 Tax=Streptomyces thioluteus TaxID=66431 RepID=UPI0031E643DD